MNVKVTIEGDFQNDVIERAIRAALESERVDFDCEVEVVITDNAGIRELNLRERGIDRVTDVLSFPMFENIGEMTPDCDGMVFLGSMVICKQRAIEQAEEYGHSIVRECAFLAVHSVLHLLGYDHELGKEQEHEMFEKQELVLENMGITR